MWGPFAGMSCALLLHIFNACAHAHFGAQIADSSVCNSNDSRSAGEIEALAETEKALEPSAAKGPPPLKKRAVSEENNLNREKKRKKVSNGSFNQVAETNAAGHGLASLTTLASEQSTRSVIFPVHLPKAQVASPILGLGETPAKEINRDSDMCLPDFQNLRGKSRLPKWTEVCYVRKQKPSEVNQYTGIEMADSPSTSSSRQAKPLVAPSVRSLPLESPPSPMLKNPSLKPRVLHRESVLTKLIRKRSNSDYLRQFPKTPRKVPPPLDNSTMARANRLLKSEPVVCLSLPPPDLTRLNKCEDLKNLVSGDRITVATVFTMQKKYGGDLVKTALSTLTGFQRRSYNTMMTSPLFGSGKQQE